MIRLSIILIKSIFSKNILVSAFIFSCIILVLGIISSNINIVLPFKFSQDLTLTFESIILHILAIFSAYKFCENSKLSQFAIANGTGKGSYIASIFISIFIVCATIAFIFSIVNFILFKLIQNYLTLELSVQLLLFCLSSVLLGGIFITLAFFTKPFNAFFYSIILFFAGSASSGVFGILEDKNINELFTTIIFWTVPNFELFNLLGAITSGASFNIIYYCILDISYFIIYYIGLFLLSTFIFKKKSL